MKLSLIATASALALTLISTAHAEDTIKIATEGVYPPFNYVEGGKLTGFDVDIANALCEKAKLKCEIVTQEWDGMIPALVAHKFDAIVASMNITEERKKKIDFTAKYYDTPAKFMAPKDAKVTDISPAALAGKTIGVQGSTTQQNFLEAKYKDSTIKTYTTVDDASADLAAGRLDVVLSDKILLDEWLKKSSDGSCCELVGDDLRDPLFGAGKGVGVRKEDTALREKLDAALKEILADGSYKTINAKYFPFSIY
ncbi:MULTISPECIES: transporter substrate-binding domain-containing protein [Rhizobium/Agrobacterium group]|uniref:Transporter substrate-binding domain-containing protein n=3 Tax=Agrobacterium TaxID=357 RepID=A0A546XJ28_AGRTU|nr:MULTISPECIES: transporter substrate-binding domain-containing protein [Rhizobium/Agrobacterium group]MCZ7472279.1 transporter substrate-binding domain-containing protein [Rhizobium rhizogenes]MCZ7483306.1 transporter substrate-binding domain-containing protein [Rhizobium rhizogenes]MCZ7501749.1 transporter substrate-binding domain-containing protein [Rhizobium rhizogenes]MCZ7911517.1 transporter substrate-binding domain-containing protein [Agrobacterium leguminum]MEB3046314.1 transporter su